MKRWDYYLHRSGGRAFDYFGGIGQPFKVCFLRWFFYMIFGFRATRVPKGAPISRVYIRAGLKQGAHRHSYKMGRLRAGDYDHA